MMRFLALILGVVLLGWGCTGPTYSYSKAGSDVADFRQDSYACVQEPLASRGASGNPMIVGTGIDAKRLYRKCMEARGWTAN